MKFFPFWSMPCLLIASVLLAPCHATGQETPFAYYTGFEPDEETPFVVGPLPQNAWEVAGVAEITKSPSEVLSGVQALAVGPQSTVDKAIDGSGSSVVWLEGWYKTTPEAEYPDLSELERGSSLVLFHDSDGIMCLDGDKSESNDGDTWKSTGVTVKASDWHRITICQDYSVQEWSCYVDGFLKLSSLGFKDPIEHLSGFRLQQGENNGGFLDEFSVQTDPLMPPFTPHELFRFSRTWRWQGDQPGPGFNESMYRRYNRIPDNVIDHADLQDLLKTWLAD